jgi:gamma-glutamyltranspeptidase/glutathione hydrolase
MRDMPAVRLWGAILALFWLASCAAPSAREPAETAQHAPVARHAMVAAANPLAVEAGLRVLKSGGSAIDAAVAVQAVLGLVEPQSSGLGGGAFLLYYDASSRTVTAYDGRETAPAAATDGLFLDSDGKPLDFFTAVLSGRSTGVPGAIAMLAMAQREHGKLPWNTLFKDASALAADGFVVSPRLAGMISGQAPQARTADALTYFTKADGSRYAAGDRLRNPAYAATLDRIARDGAQGLLAGPIAEAIVRKVASDPLPGGLSLEDLQRYRPRKQSALCRPYRIYIICTPQAPSGGPGLQIAAGILAQTDIDRRNADDPAAWFQFAEASRLAYADRDRYIGDPDFVAVPVAGLLDPSYLKQRAALIGDRAGPAPSYGRPVGAPEPGRDATREPGGTSHFVIVDAAGNVVSMTTTVESVFGSGRMVDGFFLNNQLTDFSFSPRAADGSPAANAVAPGKRPRSSMAPTIILDRQHQFVAALGSPGGSAIQAYNLKVLIALLDWRMTPQAAVSLPNLIARGDSFAGEAFPPAVAEGLRQRGIEVRPGAGEGSGLHAVRKLGTSLEGGADPRREGVARGF